VSDQDRGHEPSTITIRLKSQDQVESSQTCGKQVGQSPCETRNLILFESEEQAGLKPAFDKFRVSNCQCRCQEEQRD